MRLRRGEKLASQGADGDAFEQLAGILQPVLDHPSTLRVWMALIQRLHPERLEDARTALALWIKDVQDSLSPQPEEKPEGPGPWVPVSRTMADLLWKQGHEEEAEKIYRTLLEREPEDLDLRRQFRGRFPGRDPHDREIQPLRILEGWVRTIRRRRAVSS